MNASRVALSQAKAGVTRHLLTHRAEVTQVSDIQSDVAFSQDQLDNYTKPYLRGSGEYFANEARLDENDQLEGHDFDACSGTKQIQASKIRLESYQEVGIKTPLRIASATQTVNYGTYHHDFIDISQRTYHHLWTRGINTISWATNTQSSYITAWDVESVANQRSGAGNRRLYSDYCSIQIGQGQNTELYHPQRTQLDGDYGDFSLDVLDTIHIRDRGTGIYAETTQGDIGVRSQGNSKYYSNSRMTVEAQGNTYINGQVVFINTADQGPPQQPETYTQDYKSMEDLPDYERKPTNRKIQQPHWTDAKKNTFLQKPSGLQSGSNRFQRRQRYY